MTLHSVYNNYQKLSLLFVVSVPLTVRSFEVCVLVGVWGFKILVTGDSAADICLLFSRALSGRLTGDRIFPESVDFSCSHSVFWCKASFSLNVSLSGSTRTGFSATFGGATKKVEM